MDAKNIIVCVKQVPDTTEVKIDPKTGTLVREGVPSIINPFDQFALEEALRIKEKFGAGNSKVIVVSMGPPQARSALIKCLAIGADEAILVTDKVLAGSDTLATSYALSLAIRKFKCYVVLCGQQAIDGDTAQVGPELAQRLKLPQITYVEKLETESNKVIAHRRMGDELEVVEANLPVLLTMTTPPDFQPGNPSFSDIMKANKKPFSIWGAKELDGDENKFGLNGSPTQIKRIYSPPKRGECMMIEGPPQEAVKKLVDLLLKENVIK